MTRPVTRPLAVSPRVAGEMVGVSRDTIMAAIKDDTHHLPAKMIGSRYSIAVADLEKWHRGLPDA